MPDHAVHPPVLEVRGVSKAYRESGGRRLEAVKDVSLSVGPRETLGIVGESGCGKSTLARLIMALERVDQGEILIDGENVARLGEGRLRALRPKFQMVFQDSGSSLNPRRRVQDILRDPMAYHRILPREKLDARVGELLGLVGLPASAKDRYPHEFSGGQRQRICIARALALNPRLIILDEPVSALDVSVQAQILNLLRDLQSSLGLTCVFIGHGLGAVRYVSHRIGVMYMGRIVEMGDAQTVFGHPAHPYTRALIDAAPVAEIDSRSRPRLALKGEAHGMLTSGCPFRDRCPRAVPACDGYEPLLAPVAGDPTHLAACNRACQEETPC